MSFEYERLPDPGSGLRLHLNENTAGCSPRVLDAMRRLTREDAAFYPDYTRLVDALAGYHGVDPSSVLALNGLDEGLHAVALATLLRGDDGQQLEAIVVEPAFDMYAACADAAGGRVVFIPPREDFSFPLAELLARVGEHTRLVYLTSPNNPTGLTIPREDIFSISRALPAGGLVLLDEAYVDFSDGHLLDAVPALPNLVIGRTFAKAHGLAAVRAGAVIAQPSVIARLRRMVPPYSVNVFARAAMLAALEDDEYVEWYRGQVARSREMIYDACGRLALPFWHSRANFVLVRVGPRAAAIVRALGDRGIHVRDRSNQPGCGGCIRITAGVVEHTQRGLAALEEVLCAGR